MGDFYGTVIEIWAGFGPVRQLLMPVFSLFHGQKFFFAHEDMKKPASKVAHNRSKCFFSVMPTGPNSAQISITVP